ncbi:alpha-galactosidase [Abditibacteriota bacterium]|nr:alpha-galactosidase [Abditibacteriota bacterium]
MHALEVTFPNARGLVEIDTSTGVYHLCQQNLSIRNIRAMLFYTTNGQQGVLDLVQGGAVTTGDRKINGQHREIIEIQTQEGPIGATLLLTYNEAEPLFQISARFHLVEAEADVQLQSVVLFTTSFEDTFLAPLGRENCRFWSNSHDIWQPIGSAPLNGPKDKSDIEKPHAYHFASLYCATPPLALTFAYQMPNQWLDRIEWKDNTQLLAEDKIGATLFAGQPIISDRLTISMGPIFTEALPPLHANHVTRRRVEETRDHFGWNSWEAYQTAVTEADIVENMEEIASYLWLREGIRYITIDDGWQRNMGDWEANDKFPDGMDAIADKIRARGFQAGIWTAPFLVSKHSPLLANRPEWLLKDGDELLTRNGETFYLDPTHPEARAHLHSVYARLYSCGYRYYKTDFLVEAPMFFVPGRSEYRETARCFDPNLGIMRGMRAAMQTIRAAIGEDSFWLGCGTDIGSGALLMDASRTGGDIAPFWTRVPNQARSVIHHFHLHGNLFLADPDFTLVKGSDTFHPEFLDVPLVSPEPYVVDAWRGGRCFDSDDARTWASLVILSGGLLNLSDRIRGLNEVGLSIIKTALEYAGGSAAIPLDAESPIPRILLREEKSHYLLGLLNWDNDDSLIITATEAMGIPFPPAGTLHEIWSNEKWSVENGELTVNLAPHKLLLFKWDKAQNN